MGPVSTDLVPPDYLQRMQAAWRGDTGLVCSTPAGARPDGFWAEVERAFLNTLQARWQYAGEALGLGFAQGKSLLWHRPFLEARQNPGAGRRDRRGRVGHEARATRRAIVWRGNAMDIRVRAPAGSLVGMRSRAGPRARRLIGRVARADGVAHRDGRRDGSCPHTCRGRPVRIAILETGSPPERLIGFPSYGAMTARLVGPGHESTIFDVRAGRLPDDPEAFEGYAITGSAAGVYDPLPWIAPLVAFLRAVPPDRRLLGICFGHQVMAEAFGGRAVRAPEGRALGLHAYEVRERAPFMDAASRIAVAAFHQDQVVEKPPAARVLAASAFTPYAMLAYDDRAALSVQFHPEFEPDYTRALIAGHPEALAAPQRVQAALTSLDAPDDRHRVGVWIRRFLEQGRG